MTWHMFWLIVLLVSLGGICLTSIAIGGRWIMNRADRDADVTRFANAITAENADVVAQEAAAYSDRREALVDEMVGLLDGAIDDVEALSDAADLVDELEGLEALLDDMGTHTNRLDRAAAASPSIDLQTPERRRMRKTAYIRRAAAAARGYFWLPCPLCGTEFAGYEWEDGATIPDPEHPLGSGRGIGICPACAHEGRAVEYPPFGAAA